MADTSLFPNSVQKLVQSYEQPLPNLEAPPGVPGIKLNEVIGKMAYFYEKLRNSIEFNEEHLLRRNAIERILRRRFLVENRAQVNARLLIHELIRGRYLPNDALPETLVVVVQNYVDRYLALLDHLQLKRTYPEDRRHIRWLLSVASADLEERLSPSTRQDALVEVMYATIRSSLVLPANVPAGQEQDVLVYLAIHRALIKSDDAVLRYHLFKWAYPQWENPNHAVTEQVREKFPKLVESIEAKINHPLSERILVICRRYTIPFIILADVVREQGGAAARLLLQQPAALQEAVEEAMKTKLKTARTRLRRTSVRSIIYIFITKMMLALSIELPYEIFVLRERALLPIYINSIFHPILMFTIALTVKLPGKENTALVVQAVQEIVNPSVPREIFGARLRPRPRGKVRSFFFYLFYFATFGVTFGAIIWGLMTLQFNWLSIVVFIFFLSVISLFGTRVRGIARELTVRDRRENLFLLLLSSLSLSILRVGQWLSKKVPKVNFIVFFLDFIIEAPFKMFVEAVDEWFSFLKEKREEIS
ncbi:MAG: hypothetical protein AAB424_01305 [Patescibacteria group bacterium]